MRLLPILAAATIGAFALTVINTSGSAQQATGNPSGAQNMDTVNKGNPNTAGQTTGTGAKAAKKSKKKKARM